MARHDIQITTEVTYGTARTGSIPVGERIHLHLTGDNAFTVRKMPEIWTIQSAAFNGRKIRRGSQKSAVSGSLSTILFPIQAKYLMDWAINLTGSGDCKDLKSCTVDEQITLEDTGCTPVYKRYTGVKVARVRLQANNTGQGVLLGVSVDLVGKDAASITSTEFPAPASTDYPDQDPYVFQDSTGTLVVNGSRTNYSSIMLEINNMLTPRFDEQPVVNRIRWHNRDVKFEMTGLYKSQNDRNDYEAVTPRAISFTFTDGTTSTAFNLNSRNYLESVNDNLPLDGDFEQTLRWDSQYDISTGADVTATVTP